MSVFSVKYQVYITIYVLIGTIALICGLIIARFGFDLSKESYFVGSFRAVGHVGIGFAIGLCFAPLRYPMTENKKRDGDLGIYVRFALGVLIFIGYSLKSYLKHTKNFRRNILPCNYVSKSQFNSSISRQQFQIYLGFSLSLGLVAIPDETEDWKFLIVPAAVMLGLCIFQMILQFSLAEPIPAAIRSELIRCMKQTKKDRAIEKMVRKKAVKDAKRSDERQRTTQNDIRKQNSGLKKQLMEPE
jgi:hypothetical protein